MSINKKDKGGSKTLSPEQLQQRKKLVIFPLMFVAFAIAMYFIFRPSPDKLEEKKGLNADLPIPKIEIVDDKRTAYEQELFLTRNSQKTLSLDDYGIAPDTTKSSLIVESIRTKHKTTPRTSIQSSTNAYKRMNRDLDYFYRESEDNGRQKELEREIEHLKSQLENQNQSTEADDMQQQLQLMEESYKMAAKYIPTMPNSTPSEEESKPLHKISKPAILAVSKLNVDYLVSALPQKLDDTTLLKHYAQPVNESFHTVGVQRESQIFKNTIQACVHSEQSVVSGQHIKLRLLEPIRAGSFIIPPHELLTGVVGQQGERLTITIHSIEYKGQVLPVEILVYDVDGQEGVFIPGSLERTIGKEILSGMGKNASSSISVNQQSAVEQLAVDVGRNMIQGGSNYLSRKIQTAKITLKAGHKVLLLPKQ